MGLLTRTDVISILSENGAVQGFRQSCGSLYFAVSKADKSSLWDSQCDRLKL